MIKFFILSSSTGRGHIENMKSLERAMKANKSPDVGVETHVFSNTLLENWHKKTYRLKGTGWVYSICLFLMRNYAIRQVFRFIVRKMVYPFVQQFEVLVKKSNADFYVTTHFMQADALLRVREKLKRNFKIICYVPDFDDGAIHYVETKRNPSDAYIAPNPSLLKKLENLYPDKLKGKTVQSGFTLDYFFQKSKHVSVDEAKARLQNLLELKGPNVSNFDPKKKTIGFIGGSRWVDKVPSLINKMHKINFNWELNQIVICAGENKDIFLKVNNLHSEIRKSVICIPFVSHEILSLIYRSMDIAVLTSLAPATLYEILSSQSAPIIVHSINPYPETENLKFCLSQKLVIYKPTASKLASYLKDTIDSPKKLYELKNKHLPIYKKTVNEAFERNKKVAEFLSSFANNNLRESIIEVNNMNFDS